MITDEIKKKASPLYFATLIGAFTLFFFTLFSFPNNFVYGAVYEQLIDSDSSTTGSSDRSQTVPDVLAGNIDYFQLKGEWNPVHEYNFYILGATTGLICAQPTYGIIDIDGQIATIDFTSLTCTNSITQDVQIIWAKNPPSTDFLYGTESGPELTSNGGSLHSFWYRLFVDQEPTPIIPPTPALLETYPVNGTTTASTTFSIGADTWNDTATQVCWTLQNWDNFQSVPQICSPLFSSGSANTATTTTLPVGYYSGYAEMIGTETTGSSTQKAVNFIVVASYHYGMDTPNGSIFFGQNYATTTDMQTWCDTISSEIVQTLCMIPQRIVSLLVSVLISPDVGETIVEKRTELQTSIEGKLPFALYYDLKDRVESLAVPTTTPSNITVINMAWGTTTMINFPEVKSMFSDLIQEETIAVILHLAITFMSIIGVIAVFRIMI